MEDLIVIWHERKRMKETIFRQKFSFVGDEGVPHL